MYSNSVMLTPAMESLLFEARIWNIYWLTRWIDGDTMQDISLIQTLQSLVAGQHLDLAPKPSGSGLKLITAAGMVGLLVLLVSINAPQSKRTKTDKVLCNPPPQLLQHRIQMKRWSQWRSLMGMLVGWWTEEVRGAPESFVSNNSDYNRGIQVGLQNYSSLLQWWVPGLLSYN